MKNNKGFSLVELIIVIAIMAVLIGVLAPQYLKYVEKSRVSSDKQSVASVVEAVNTVLTDESVYDTNINSGSVSFSDSGLSGNDAVTTAVKSVVGDFKLQSKTYKGKTYSVGFAFNSTDSTWSVSSVEEVLGGGQAAST
jgi:type IV pilus assembly protein PilA